jgi:hypothetical protein
MKTVREFREPYRQFTDIETLDTSVTFLKKYNELDFDVYLPTRDMNLQRKFVWDDKQKRELIYSILIGRKLPSFAFVLEGNHKFQIIDGKQRISTIFDFIDGKFPIALEFLEEEIPSGIEPENLDFYPVYYGNLPEDFQLQFDRLMIQYYRFCVPIDGIDQEVFDEFRINWFYFLNHAGTPQEKEHMLKLKPKKKF